MTSPSLSMLASIDDFTARLGRSLDGGANGGPERDRANAALYDASTYIRTVTGQTWSGDEGDEPPDDIMPVACAVALRVFRNPGGLSSETIGQYTWRGADGTPAGIYLTEVEQQLVVRYRDSKRRRGLWTISTGGRMPASLFVDVEGGGDSFPLYGGEDPTLRGATDDQLGGEWVEGDGGSTPLSDSDWLP